MSAEDEQPADQPVKSDERERELTSTHQTKLEVHYRDRYQCLNCGEPLDEDPGQADVDHRVPKGSGGADLHRNLGTLCKDCHLAKHNDDVIAPTIRFTSTGDMSDKEFRWYRHFWNEVLPALMQAAVGHKAEVLINISNNPM